MAATDLFDLAAEYLAAVAAALVTTDAGVPDRAYVSPGAPAFDCEQVTVHVGGPVEADTAPLAPPLMLGERTQVQGAVFLIQMTATIVRCTAVSDEDGNPPPIADLEASAMKIHADVWATWNFCRDAIRQGLLFASPSGRREVFFDPAVSLEISGGVAGWQIPIRVQLGGYRFSS